MSSAIFFRLLAEEDKAAALEQAVRAVGRNESTPFAYVAEPSSFHQIPTSPFAYWISEYVRSLFRLMPRFGTRGRDAQIGASTKDNFRYLRTWWEIQPEHSAREREEAINEKRWIPFAKAGTFSPYYLDFDLVIDWKNDGEELKREISEYRGSRGWGYHWTAALNGHRDYFKSGLTYGIRVRRFSPHVLPKGSIFSASSPRLSVEDGILYLALLNSSIFKFFLSMQTAVRKIEVGHVENFPIPKDVEHHELAPRLRELGLIAFHLKRDGARATETSHAFHLPSLLAVEGSGLSDRLVTLHQELIDKLEELARIQKEVDEIAYHLYGASEHDQRAIEASIGQDGPVDSDSAEGREAHEELEEPDKVDEEIATFDQPTLISDLLSHALGCVFGRWDVRLVVSPNLIPKLNGAFDPLPVCSPGMLVGPDGLPVQRGRIASESWLRARTNVITLPPDGSVAEPVIADEAYPLRIDWDGILVDDEEHADDVVRRVLDVLALLWGDRAEAIEQEACAILGVRGLRDYFRNPRHFWEFHVKRYSKSRRKAPIYWLLQSSKRAYGLWLYYPRLDADTLFKALGYVGNRLLLEQGRLEEALGQRRAIGEGDARTRRALDKRIEAHETFVSEVAEFRTELQRVADLGLTVDHDDGVLLSIAPLHNLVPWSPAKAAWNELVAGKYGWSGIGKQLRAKGLVRESVRG